jgi:hypothetical protein
MQPQKHGDRRRQACKLSKGQVHWGIRAAFTFIATVVTGLAGWKFLSFRDAIIEIVVVIMSAFVMGLLGWGAGD